MMDTETGALWSSDTRRTEHPGLLPGLGVSGEIINRNQSIINQIRSEFSPGTKEAHATARQGSVILD